jgi:hypothetical protein
MMTPRPPEIPTSVSIKLTDTPSGAPISIVDPGGKSTPADEEAAKQKIMQALDGHPPDVQRRALLLLQAQYDEEMRKAHDARREMEARKAAEDNLVAWFDGHAPIKLERNDCSRLHKLKEAAANGDVIAGQADKTMPADMVALITQLQHTFVIQHDWAGAFEGAEGLEGEFHLPYDECAFEFRITGRTVIIYCGPGLRLTPTGHWAFVETQDYWCAMTAPNRISEFAVQHVKAVCIALDAEVASSTVVRAPHKLNEKRARDGRPPLPDYRVVDLSRRHRIANPLTGHGEGSKKRLHFRRGHWRHYETSKTWVKWCLVGDPDLGFIQKSYTL